MPETWYVHQDDANDELGGWCVLTVDRPPRTLTGEDVDAGRRLVADFLNEADARRIADLHNAEAMFVCESCPDDGWGCCGSWNDGFDRCAFVAGRRRERRRITVEGARAGYDQAIATLRQVWARTGSPAARWAVDYLTTDPDRLAPVPGKDSDA